MPTASSDPTAAAEHDLLREATRGFLARHEPLSRLRAGLEHDRVLDRERWRSAVGMGWIAAALPDEPDFTLADAEVIAEELGRGLFAGPYLGCTTVARILALGDGPGAAHRSALTDGTATAAWCAGGVRATRAADGGRRLDGEVAQVLDADLADLLLVTAAADEGTASFVVAAGAPGVTVEVLPGLDLTRRLASVRLDGVVVAADALAGAGPAHARDLAATADVAAVLVAADAVGCAERLMERTVEYAQQRIAFGRTIASYQAVKHRCADMLCAVEGARLLVRHAAVRLHRGAADAHAAVAGAKAFAGEQCAAVCGESLQIHGGIGFTWEHDLHLYLRRAKADEVLFGTPGGLYDELGAALAAR